MIKYSKKLHIMYGNNQQDITLYVDKPTTPALAVKDGDNIVFAGLIDPGDSTHQKSNLHVVVNNKEYLAAIYNGEIYPIPIYQRYPDTYKTMTELPADEKDADFVDAISIADYYGNLSMLKTISAIPAEYDRCVNMNGLFCNDSSLTSIPTIDTHNVASANNMFKNCSSLASIPGLDLRSCKEAQSMFEGCRFQVVSILNADSLTATQSMFKNCTALASVPQLNTQNCKVFDSMFEGCSSLTAVSWKIDMSSAMSVKDMFKNCNSLKTVVLKNVPTKLDITSLGVDQKYITVLNHIS